MLRFLSLFLNKKLHRILPSYLPLGICRFLSTKGWIQEVGHIAFFFTTTGQDAENLGAKSPKAICKSSSHARGLSGSGT